MACILFFYKKKCYCNAKCKEFFIIIHSNFRRSDLCERSVRCTELPDCSGSLLCLVSVQAAAFPSDQFEGDTGF